MGKQLPERQTRICGKQQVVGESILTLILHLSADDCGTHCLQSDLSLRMAIVTKTSCVSMAMWVPPVPTKYPALSPVWNLHVATSPDCWKSDTQRIFLCPFCTEIIILKCTTAVSTPPLAHSG